MLPIAGHPCRQPVATTVKVFFERSFWLTGLDLSPVASPRPMPPNRGEALERGRGQPQRARRL